MRIFSQDVSRKQVSPETSGEHVFLARDRLSSADVYVRNAHGSSPREIEAIKRQFSLHRTLSQSGTVDAHDLILSAGSVAGFTMPVLEGGSLTDVCAAMESRALLAVLRDTAFAVFGLHSLGYIHGDITSNNVWVSQGEVGQRGTLLDLGFSLPVGTRMVTEIRGTPGHISPEARLGRALGQAADAYSFGVMLDSCLTYCSDLLLRDKLRQLATMCSEAAEETRLSDFSVIYATLVRIGRATVDPQFPHSEYSLPLRMTGLPSRTKTTRERLRASKDGVVIWCHGCTGSGKSELIRYICHDAQEQGISTIRFDGVSCAQELIAVLESLDDARNGGLTRDRLIFVETLPECEMDSENRSLLHEYAADRKIAIVCELRMPQNERIVDGRDSMLCRPFTFRECMHATGHLLINPGIAVHNTEAVMAVTDGNPHQVRDVMTTHFRCGRRGRGESVDFGRHNTAGALCVTGDRRSDATVVPSRVLLTKKVESAEGSSNRQQRQKLMELRTAAGQNIREYRNFEHVKKGKRFALSKTISGLFSDLGSIRRQSRWLHRGVNAYLPLLGDEHSDNEFGDFITALGRVLLPDDALHHFRVILKSDKALSPRIRCLVRAEVGASYLHARKPDEAQKILHEAMALCSRHAECRDLEALTLNRLGIAKMLLKEYGPAREYLIRASSLAQDVSDRSVLTRIQGNLGFLALHSAEPDVALQWFRRHKLGVIQERRHADYVSSLLNQTSCYVDIGRGRAAERRSRLAILLAEMLSDDLRLAQSHANFAWLMTMRCNGYLAKSSYSKAVAIRKSIGDREGMAYAHLNMARLHLVARNYDSGGTLIDQAKELFANLPNHEGLRDCQRLAAKRALLLQEYDSAKSEIETVLSQSDNTPPKDHADALLLKLELLLWTRDWAAGEQALKSIDALASVSNVHPLRGRRELLAGFLAFGLGDVDLALARVNTSVSMFRESSRDDLVLEAITIFALLAYRMNNRTVGFRHVRYIEVTAARIRQELV